MATVTLKPGAVIKINYDVSNDSLYDLIVDIDLVRYAVRDAARAEIQRQAKHLDLAFNNPPQVH